MARICTTRNAENNKNASMKITNRVSAKPTTTEYGEEIYTYGDIKCLDLCLMPFKTEAEAKAYGVSFRGGRRATITIEECNLFNEFTHIWVDKLPDEDKQNSEYIVKDIKTMLSTTVLVVEKKDGENG